MRPTIHPSAGPLSTCVAGSSTTLSAKSARCVVDAKASGVRWKHSSVSGSPRLQSRKRYLEKGGVFDKALGGAESGSTQKSTRRRAAPSSATSQWLCRRASRRSPSDAA